MRDREPVLCPFIAHSWPRVYLFCGDFWLLCILFGLSMRVNFLTVGCKLNNCETEVLERHFSRAGWDVVSREEPSDVTVVNTCTVTARSDADCRKLIRRAKAMNPAGKVVVTGCLAERTPDALAGMPEVAAVIGNSAKKNLLSIVTSELQKASGGVIASEDPDGPGFLPLSPLIEPLSATRTRATVQVQDGCDEHCTYCIVPRVRGRSRSRPITDIVAETENLVASGSREIALTGVNTGAWGGDLGAEGGIAAVVDAILRVQTPSGRRVERLRLNSLEPQAITPGLVRRCAMEPRVCRHFHVPLQSGSDAILRKMNRRYTAAEYAQKIELIAGNIPDAAIGADVMVGFPGETDEQFRDTIELVQRLPLTYLHVFAFSPREGTPALRLGPAISSERKHERSRALRELGNWKRLEFHLRHVGNVVTVLLEGKPTTAATVLRGLTDNYIRVSVRAPSNRINTFVPVYVEDASRDGARGVLVDERSASFSTARGSQE